MNAILTALSNEQEWCSGESTPHQCGLGSNPGIDSIRGYTSFELIVGYQSLAPRSFSPLLWFSMHLKTQHYQTPIRSGKHRHVLKRTPKCSVGKQVTITMHLKK